MPENSYSDEKLTLIGSYESASECGGDWWHYKKRGKFLDLWIGDVTGHGVGAALVASAAKSASALIEQMPNFEPKEVMRLMNNSIHQTSKGRLMMTCIVARLDTETREMLYCNASHTWPFWMQSKKLPVHVNDLDFLGGIHGPRLGQVENAEYKQDSITVDPGDLLCFYTDGVTELVNEKGQQIGDRSFARKLLKSFNNKNKISEVKDHVEETLSNFRKDTPLADDVTYFLLQV